MSGGLHFNQILVDHIGGLGRWQIWVLSLMWIVDVFDSTKSLIQTVGAYKPPYRCFVPTCDTNESAYDEQWYENFKNGPHSGLWEDQECSNLVFKGKGDFVDLCNADLGAIREKDLGSEPCTRWIYDRKELDETMTTEFDLVCDRKHLFGFLGSLFMLGLLLGSLLGGYVSDTLGRKRTYIFGRFLIGPLYFGQAFVQDYTTYAFMRLALITVSYISGLGSFTLRMELIGPRYRPLFCLVRDLSFPLGNILVGALAFGIKDWRYLHLAVSSPLLLAPLLYFVLPESIMWLMSKGKSDEARQGILRIAKGNKRPLTEEKADELIRELGETLAKEEQDNETRIWDLVTSKSSLKILFFMAINWVAVNVSWYGLALNLDFMRTGSILVNFMLMNAIDLPAAVLTFILNKLVSRRRLLMCSQLVAGLSCTSMGLVTLTEAPAYVTTILCMIGKSSASISFSVVYLYTLELFPTQMRSSSLGVCSAIARVFGLAVPFVKSLDLYWSPLPLLTLGIPSIVGGLLVSFLPETKDKALPENMKQAQKLEMQELSSSNTD